MIAWAWLSIGLLFGLFFMSIFYGHCIMSRLSPNQCGAKWGSYAVEPGAYQPPLKTCNGDCVFGAPTLQSAINKCNEYNCKSFHYDGVNITIVDTRLDKSQNNGGLYTRIG